MCSRILKAHAIELGIDPSFEIAEEDVLNTLRDEAIEEVLRDAEAACLDANLRAELLEKVNRTSQMDGMVDILKEWGDLSVLLSAAGPLLGFLNHTGLLENGERK